MAARFLPACVVLAIAAPQAALAQPRPVALAAARGTVDIRAWDERIEQMIQSRELRARESTRDEMVAGRLNERFDQFFQGIRIVGGDITRQTDASGTVSAFGVLHAEVNVNPAPALSIEEARLAIGAAASGEFFGASPELVVLPLSDGYHLAYSGQASTGVQILNVFVDASSGALLRTYSDFLTDGVIGSGVGAYGDQKKVSVKPLAGAFVTDDGLRPGAITTYDMKGDLNRTVAILNRVTSVVPADIGTDSDDVWTDSTVVDGHVYAGWYYDFLFKRFGRRGIDNNNLRIAAFTHPVRQQNIGTADPSVRGLYYINAFSCSTCGPDGRGAVVFGEGAPRNFFPGLEIKPFTSALDVVAHELTHNVTAATARLNGFPYSEGGALNEAFSDIFGTSAAFFLEPVGNGPLQASYLQGRDLSVPAGVLSRSLANPASTRDPDHYSQRFVGGDPHFNSTIASHAFYLAIEGGTNRTSGLPVQGVGAANREQIEKAFFRALTVLMPSSSTFALTRRATIQAARDLSGAGSAAERAITQAWDAVGVQDRTAPTAAMLPNPATPSTAVCTGVGSPHWVIGVTVSAGTSNLLVGQWTWNIYDHADRLQQQYVRSAAQFAQSFSSCGPGSNRVLAQTDACTAICFDLSGDTSGSTEMAFTAIDDAGRGVTFSTPRVTLNAP